MYYDDPFAAAGALVAAFFVALIIPFIIAYVLFSVFYMKLFEKAGVNDKWRAWIPVYREMIFFKIGDMNPWLVLIFLVGGGVLSVIYVGSILLAAYGVFWAMAVIRISFKAKNEAAWAALALGLPGLGSIIWLGIMAFTKDPWQPQIPQAKWAAGFLGDKTDWAGVPFGGVPAPAYGGAQGYGYGEAPADPYGYPAAPAAPQDTFGAPQAPYGAGTYGQPAAPQDPFAAPPAPPAAAAEPEWPAAPEAPAEPEWPAPSAPQDPPAAPNVDFGEPPAAPDADPNPPADPPRS